MWAEEGSLDHCGRIRSEVAERFSHLIATKSWTEASLNLSCSRLNTEIRVDIAVVALLPLAIRCVPAPPCLSQHYHAINSMEGTYLS